MMPRLLTGLALCVTAFSAQAQFVILDPAQTAPATSVSAATGTPLRDALRRIVPSDWNAFVAKNLNASMPVEYMPGQTWNESLKNLADRHNLVFSVDTAAKKVFVDEAPGGARRQAASSMPAPAQVAVVNTETRYVQTGPVVLRNQGVSMQLPDGRLRFEVRDGQRRSEALRAFLGAGNWNLAWEAGSDVVLKEGFVSAGTDIKSILDDVLPNFRMHSIIHRGNNTVVVLSNSIVAD